MQYGKKDPLCHAFHGPPNRYTVAIKQNLRYHGLQDLPEMHVYPMTKTSIHQGHKISKGCYILLRNDGCTARSINQPVYRKNNTPSIPKYKNVFHTSIMSKTFLYFGTEGVQYSIQTALQSIFEYRQGIQTCTLKIAHCMLWPV